MTEVPEGAVFWFVNEAESRGVTAVNHCGDPETKTWALEEIGNGCAWIDFDRDRDQDLFIVDASTLVPGEKPGDPWTIAGDGRSTLYENDGTGHFTDITEKSRAMVSGFGVGVSVADFDNDRDPDLYITCWGPNRLLRNDGGGRFTDVSDHAGVAKNSWSVGSCWFDAEGDGDLDLYVANYFAMNEERDPECWKKRDCDYRTLKVACGPQGMVAEKDHFFLNNGNGTFEDVSATCGIWDDVVPQYGLGAVAFDFDSDNDMDIYVANDSRGNFLFENDGKGHFTQLADLLGASLNRDGVPQAGMGIACGDFDNDRDADLFLTNFSHDYNTLYRNDSGMEFLDISRRMGMKQSEFFALSWGTEFADFDNDGSLDLVVANGHVYPEADERGPELAYRQRNTIYRQVDGEFVDVSDRAGPGFERRSSSRGLACGDADNDGDLDLVIIEQNETPSLLINETPGGRSLMVSLQATDDNRDAVGSRVVAFLGDSEQVRFMRRGHSFASCHDPRLHFGLGAEGKVDRIEVTWPNGTTSQYTSLPAQGWVLLRQGQDDAEVRQQ